MVDVQRREGHGVPDANIRKIHLAMIYFILFYVMYFTMLSQQLCIGRLLAPSPALALDRTGMLCRALASSQNSGLAHPFARPSVRREGVRGRGSVPNTVPDYGKRSFES